MDDWIISHSITGWLFFMLNIHSDLSYNNHVKIYINLQQILPMIIADNS